MTAEDRPPLRVALAGNPNAGKTTLFNALTGARQHVGNYPGVTVDLKEGEARYAGTRFTMVDLPGTYSLTARSDEEIIARNFLIEQQPDVVVVILDASNLERNLYLAVQLMELGQPLVMALNMWDLLRDKGLQVDTEKLSRLIDMPVVTTIGHKGRGVPELLAQAAQAAKAGRQAERAAWRVDYGREIEPHVESLTDRVAAQPALSTRARWYALKLLEGDPETQRRVRRESPAASAALLEEAARLRKHIEQICGDDIGTMLADRRYGFIAGLCAEIVSRTSEARMSHSERIDRVVLSRWLGLPLFALLMYLVFQLTFTLAEPLMGAVENGFGLLGRWVSGLWPEGSESLLRSLLVDGIIGGVGGVLVFLPSILLLFAAIAFLEDSGYMARAAFIMDRLMHKIGLHGKSFIPMLVGFGCTVPAIMGTRTLESRRDRLTTIMVLPLMSCGARLTIYALFIPAFFTPAWRAPVLWSIYVTGIFLAIVGAKVLRSTLFRGESVPFVMELPPYRMPTWRGLGIHMWDRCWMFLRKAGTIILGISILLWALSIWPRPAPQARATLVAERATVLSQGDLEPEQRDDLLAALDHRAMELRLQSSVVGRIGRTIEPAFRPLGFDWRISTALIGAFAAKEVFVAQLGIVFALGTEDEASEPLRDRLRDVYTPLQAFAIMLFMLISIPCMATVAITRRETGSWKWAALQLAGLTVLAWVTTALVYQGGRLLLGS